MAWEQQGSRRYYYRSRRIGQRVVREFYGNGLEAHLAASLDQQRQSRRRAEREARVQATEAWQEASGPLQELIQLTDLLVHAALLADGYHQHHQSEWRKRRGSRQGTTSK